MAEYINKEKAISIAERYGLKNGASLGRHSGIADLIMEQLEGIKAEDVAPVIHGKWLKVYSNKMASVYECSECKHLTLGTSDYCICGAKMK